MTTHVAIVYKNFAAYKGISHIGLGVTALTNAEILNDATTKVEVWPARHNIDIVDEIRKNPTVTHVIISAPWVSSYDLRAMVRAFPFIQFVVVSHSNVGFLQADPHGTRLIREGIEMSREFSNFHIGANCKKFADWIEQAFGCRPVLLPNLYPIGKIVPQKRWKRSSGVLRIGNFGAIRPQKNNMTAAGAAIVLGRMLRVPVELWLSSGREDGGGQLILNCIRNMTRDLPGFTLVEAPWRPWDLFKTEVVGKMNLLFQISYTESFNNVTADGIQLGIPSVTSEAIDWTPQGWQANIDNACDIARVGLRLLTHPRLFRRGVRGLHRHNAEGIKLWREFLHPKPKLKMWRLWKDKPMRSIAERIVLGLLGLAVILILTPIARCQITNEPVGPVGPVGSVESTPLAVPADLINDIYIGGGDADMYVNDEYKPNSNDEVTIRTSTLDQLYSDLRSMEERFDHAEANLEYRTEQFNRAIEIAVEEQQIAEAQEKQVMALKAELAKLKGKK